MHKTKIVNPSKLFYFVISILIPVFNFLINYWFRKQKRLVRGVSQGDRYLGMTAAMTQIPVPTATHLSIKQFTHCYNFLENSAMSVVFQSKRCNKRQVDGLLE